MEHQQRGTQSMQDPQQRAERIKQKRNMAEKGGKEESTMKAGLRKHLHQTRHNQGKDSNHSQAFLKHQN